MKKYTNFEIINNMVGGITAIGETNYDEKSLENLDEVDTIITNYIRVLIKNANQRCRPESSMSKVGMRSYDILKDIVEMIDNGLEE